MESNPAEQQKEKGIIKNEKRLRELSNIIKCNSIHITGIPEEEEEREGDRKLI